MRGLRGQASHVLYRRGPQLRHLLDLDTTPVSEFDAWRAGAEVLLERQGGAPIERDLLGFMASGELRPHISRRYSLEESPNALRDMLDRKLVGKVVVEP